MRDAFIKELLSQAAGHEDAFLIVGDLGFSVVEPFAERFPQRFLNAGIAEQNMTGLAAGLAQTGFNVFTYSIANFPTIRCLEQIRNDVCYHQANVKVVSVGAGLAYGSLGYSHHAVQDLACLRSLPGMLMATPCDPLETQAVVEYLCTHRGPAYLRLGKAKEPAVHAERPRILSAPALVPILPGDRQAVLACGGVAELAKHAARMTGAALYSAALWSMDHATERAILQFVERYDRVVVAEEHLRSGGFGSMVRECLETRPDLQARVRCVSLDPKVCGLVGSQSYLRTRGGLTTEAILHALLATDRPALPHRHAA
jgi:transketolase